MAVKRAFVCFAFAVAVFLLSGCDAGETGMTILDNLIPILFAVATPIILVLARALVRWLEKKLDYDISVDTEMKLYELIEEGIAFAEEQARKSIKEEKKLPPGDKLRLAIEYVRARLEDMKLPDMAGDKLAKLIEAKLGQGR